MKCLWQLRCWERMEKAMVFSVWNWMAYKVVFVNQLPCGFLLESFLIPARGLTSPRQPTRIQEIALSMNEVLLSGWLPTLPHHLILKIENHSWIFGENCWECAQGIRNTPEKETYSIIVYEIKTQSLIVIAEIQVLIKETNIQWQIPTTSCQASHTLYLI